MKYLVDVNVISEATKPHPAPSVIDWLRNNEAFSGHHLVHSMVDRAMDKMERTSLAFMDLLQEPTK